MIGQIGRADLPELLGRLDLGPVPAVREDVQRGPGDHLQRHEGTVEGVHPVLASPGEQGRTLQLVGVAPDEAVLVAVRVPEGHAHRLHRLLRARRRRVGEALGDQLVGDEVLVDDHRGDERPHRLLGRRGAELHESLDALGRVGVEEAQVQPARAHQHEPADPLRVEQGEPRRGAAAQAVAEQVEAFDAQLVEQVLDRLGGEAEVVALDGRLVALPEAGLVDEQRPEVLGEARQCRAEVRPRRCTRSAAVQHHQRQAAADGRGLAGLVVVERQVAGLGGPPSGLAIKAGHQYIPGSTLCPNSCMPYICSARSGSLAACTRPACASRHARWR